MYNNAKDTVVMRIKYYLIILGISMLPIIELRGAIPYAAIFNIGFLEALPFAIIGNLIPVPFILLFFKFFFKKFRNAPLVGTVFTRVHNKALKEADKIKNYAMWGLYIFVAIPLPGTGAWTGSVIASLLEMDNKKSFLAIFAGVITSGLIMGFVSYGLWDIVTALIK